MPDLRILSLLSSATEIVHALRLGQYQVGRSHECNFPPEVMSLPVCSRPTIPVCGSSAEIDRLVKDRVAQAASIYELDVELVRSLRPTHILTQTQCKVCAVSLDDVERSLRAEIDADVRVVSLEPYALVDVWEDIRRVAKACGHRESGEALVNSLRTRMQVIEQRAGTSHVRPTVAAIEWFDPLMAAGNWVPELIERAGGRNLFGTAGQHSPWMTNDELMAADPDLIVGLPCGFDLARTRKELPCLTGLAGWSSLRTVRQGRVYICDGDQFMNRPGPRLVESLQIFAEMIHPELFEPALEHIGWERI